ncbi:MAG: BrnT family toxin [Oligoflexales bacterium]|nr:BrnT family toxin [Oligoflexales bacterium]
MFEWDESKNAINTKKHGISFKEATKIWRDEKRLTLPTRFEDEPRQIVIGKISGTIWSAIITYRGSNIRIISVRKSRNKERELYEKDENKA